MGRVFVAGSINMDVVATAARYPKPGETVAGREVFFLPGGKGANQAVAAARLGAPTALIGCIGRDGFGGELKAFLSSRGIDLQHVRTAATAPSGTALIVLAEGDNAIVVVPGANAEIGAADIARADIARGDVLVSQFEIPTETVAAFFARGRACGARTILNPAPAIEAGRELLAAADVVILNETELAFFARRKVDVNDAPTAIADAARALRAHAGQVVCVTIGRRGAVAVIDAQTHVIAGREVEVVDTTGAGDCFVGGLAAELARGAPLREALDFANRAASICVQRMGAGPAMPDRDEVSGT
jgi:ribokinase